MPSQYNGKVRKKGSISRFSSIAVWVAVARRSVGIGAQIHGSIQVKSSGQCIRQIADLEVSENNGTRLAILHRLLRVHQGVPDDGETPTFAVYSLVNYWDDNFSRLAKRNIFKLHMPFPVLSNFLNNNVQLSLSQSSALRLPASECNCTCLPP